MPVLDAGLFAEIGSALLAEKYVEVLFRVYCWALLSSKYSRLCIKTFFLGVGMNNFGLLSNLLFSINLLDLYF